MLIGMCTVPPHSLCPGSGTSTSLAPTCSDPLWRQDTCHHLVGLPHTLRILGFLALTLFLVNFFFPYRYWNLCLDSLSFRLLLWMCWFPPINFQTAFCLHTKKATNFCVLRSEPANLLNPLATSQFSGLDLIQLPPYKIPQIIFISPLYVFFLSY